MKYLTFIIVIFTIFGFESVASFKWSKDQIPNPFIQPAPFCNLKESGIAFCNPDKELLDESQIKFITQMQRDITKLGKCPCSEPCKDGESGLVVGLVIVEEIETSNKQLNTNEANSPSLQEFSDAVRQQWNLGACDNSVLITIATVPKQYGLSIGTNAFKVLNETWLNAILEENFRERNLFNLNGKIKNILYMLKEAIKEELQKNEVGLDGSVSSLTDSSNNSAFYNILVLAILIFITLIFVLIALILLRHRKENDDISLRDVWTKKFWLKAGNQYKEAKQSETGNEKDLEKNEKEEVKAKLASTEDLKPVDDIENLDEEKIQYPKLSKV